MTWFELIDDKEGIALLLAYLSMLRVPHTSPWRLANQAAYAGMRDRLASLVDCDAQEMQDACEGAVSGGFVTLDEISLGCLQ